MQRDDLRTEQVIPILDALGQRELDFAFVVVQACHSPGAVRVQSVFPDLEPLESRNCCRQRTVYLGEIYHDRSQMAGVNGIGCVCFGL